MEPELPLPPHFDPGSVAGVWRVPYAERADEAERWARRHDVRPAAEDTFRLCLLLVDMQNTFCTPGFELFVAGRSGTGAVDDSRRLCEFLYRNLSVVTHIIPTLDTHQALQVFHPSYLVDGRGEHPPPFTVVTVEDVEQGVWRFNPTAAKPLGIGPDVGERRLLDYVRRLRAGGKYDLVVWPYHSMLGGIGHALVSAVEEAVFFHGLARGAQPEFRAKGANPFTEHYSALHPEVASELAGEPIAARDDGLVERLLDFDAVVVAGQAKSHCVAWSIADLLADRRFRESAVAKRVYILEDCTSPVVVPGVVDYTDAAEAAFAGFVDAGLHVVQSADPLASWPGLDLS